MGVANGGMAGFSHGGQNVSKQENESELQKIYNQKQYTEIAMSILSQLKTPMSLKKS